MFGNYVVVNVGVVNSIVVGLNVSIVCNVLDVFVFGLGVNVVVGVNGGIVFGVGLIVNCGNVLLIGSVGVEC